MLDKNTLKEYLELSNQIEDKLIESGGEITEEIEKLLAVKECALPEKIDRTSGFIKRMNTISELYEQEAEKYLKIAKASKNLANKCRDYIKENMIESELTELVGNKITYKLLCSQNKTNVYNEDVLPIEYVNYVKQIDVEKIKRALKAGHQIPGAQLSHSYTLKESLTKPK